MLPLDLMLLVAFVPALLLPFVAIHFRSGKKVYLLALPACVAAAAVLVSGFRLQLAPAYALSVVLTLPLFLQVNRSWPVLVGRVALVLVLGLEAALVF